MDLNEFETRVILNGYIEEMAEKLVELTNILVPSDYVFQKKSMPSKKYLLKLEKVLFTSAELNELAVLAEEFADILSKLEEEGNAEE